MSIKEALSTPQEHILEARQIAERLNNKKPEHAIQMIAEIKRFYIKIKEKEIEKVENL